MELRPELMPPALDEQLVARLAKLGGPFATLVNAGSAIWFVSLGLVLFGPEEYRRTIALLSLAYPVMYLSLSAYVTVTRKR